MGQKDKGTSVTVASPVPPPKAHSLEGDVSPVRRTEVSSRKGPNHIFVMLSVACVSCRLVTTSGLLFSILFRFIMFTNCVWMYVPQHVYGDQRTTLWSQLCPSTCHRGSRT